MDDDDISDDATILYSGGGGPYRSTPAPAEPIAREYTLKFLIQSSQELSIREAAGKILQLLYAIVQIEPTVPNSSIV
jgi:hypothetical protein